MARQNKIVCDGCGEEIQEHDSRWSHVRRDGRGKWGESVEWDLCQFCSYHVEAVIGVNKEDNK